MHDRGSLYGLTLCIIVLTSGCADARIARLERRVDSLAVTLTAVVDRVSGQAGVRPSDTATVSTEGGISIGNSTAPVVIVEFTDYQCPFCARHAATTLPVLRRDYVASGQVRYVVRDMPIETLHPFAKRAAQAARCAADQGPEQFWRYHDSLFAEQRELADALFPRLARAVGLDTARFAACLRSPAPLAAIERDAREAARVGFQGTPAFVVGIPNAQGFVKGTVIRGAYPIATFKQVLDSALRGSGRAGP